MNATEKRTDIHRPSSEDFDPEAYMCYGVFDMNPDYPAPEMVQHRMALIKDLLSRGYRFGHGGSTRCGHCGTAIRYAALMVRDDVKQFIYVGETCLDNRFEMTKGEFQALRKQASLNRERMAKRSMIEAVLAEHPTLVWASYAYNIEAAGGEIVWVADMYADVQYATEAEAQAEIDSWDNTWARENTVPLMEYKRGTKWGEKTRTGFETATLADIWDKVVRYGNPSPKQVAFAERLVAKLEQAEERLQARTAQAAEARAQGVEVPSGRIEVEGVILSSKFVDNQYGGSVKMLVQADEGWKVYGTQPDSIMMANKGDRVRFTATLEQSKDDSLFGFYKRPTKASKVS